MNDAAYVLGIDIGTTGARVGIFDLKGNPIVFCSENFPLYTPASGRAEQDANDWWEAVCKASKKAVATAKIDPAAIRGMSLDTTCCTVLLSGDDMVPLQNAILWMDVRASEQAKRIYQSGHDALKYNGYGMVSAECLPAKALWIKENQPELWNKATRFYECTDWLTYKLTGKYTASINCASARWYYNAAEGGYPVDFYEKLVDQMDKFINKANLIHGDLSSYNILNFNEEPVIIDVSQSVVKDHIIAQELLERDIKNISFDFAKMGVDTSIEDLTNRLIK